MTIEISDDLLDETIKQLTDQINCEMEWEDPCPGIGVSPDKKVPWYVELRNHLEAERDRVTPKKIADSFLGSDAQGTDAYDDFLKALTETMEEDYE